MLTVAVNFVTLPTTLYRFSVQIKKKIVKSVSEAKLIIHSYPYLYPSGGVYSESVKGIKIVRMPNQ